MEMRSATSFPSDMSNETATAVRAYIFEALTFLLSGVRQLSDAETRAYQFAYQLAGMEPPPNLSVDISQAFAEIEEQMVSNPERRTRTMAENKSKPEAAPDAAPELLGFAAKVDQFDTERAFLRGLLTPLYNVEPGSEKIVYGDGPKGIAAQFPAVSNYDTPATTVRDKLVERFNDEHAPDFRVAGVPCGPSTRPRCYAATCALSAMGWL